MTQSPDQRRYDTLRLLAERGPIGSVYLTSALRDRGYDITERAVRMTLADLEEAGLAEKVGGRGRRLTDRGRRELARGDVHGRVEQVRERLSDLLSRASYDPSADAGDVVVGTVRVPQAAAAAAWEAIEALDASPLGPLPVAVTETGDHLELAAASSVTVDGVLLGAGIGSRPDTTGIVEFDATAAAGPIVRYTDVIGDERATFDIVSLLIEAGRPAVEPVLADEAGLCVADYREVPLARFDDIDTLVSETHDALGGTAVLSRPREPGPFPWGQPGWSEASLTNIGPAEALLSLMAERGLATTWETLAGVRDRDTLIRPTHR